MRALGRVYNIVPGASGAKIDLTQCSGVGFLAVASTTATTSLTFTAYPGFSGSVANVTTANGFGQPATWYQQVSSGGAAAWTAQTASWASNVLTIGATAGYASYVDFLVSELADTYDYLVATAVNCTLTAILYDLDVQRTPQNLKIIAS